MISLKIIVDDLDDVFFLSDVRVSVYSPRKGNNFTGFYIGRAGVQDNIDHLCGSGIDEFSWPNPALTGDLSTNQHHRINGMMG